MTTCNLPIFCREYFELMDLYPDEFCNDQWQLREHVIKTFDTENLSVDLDLYEKYIGLGKYLGFGTGYEWERFVIGCHLCTYKDDGRPRWPDLFAVMGRGAGKDGLISWEALCLISPYNPVPMYDVDICAFNEEQALRPVLDVFDALETNPVKMKRFFKWTKEKIRGLKNGGYIKGHTNNAKGKDGLRSGAVFLNEIHTYEGFENINVFTTGLGKKMHPRKGYFTTNGDVIGGPLDILLENSKAILEGAEPDDGFFPFICKLDSKDEVSKTIINEKGEEEVIGNETAWHKANPSLRYKPDLQDEIRKEYKEWKKNPLLLPAFMTKRMNIRQTAEAMPAAKWEDIAATNKPLPDMRLWDCVVGIDFSKTTDWVGVNLHFKRGDQRYDINHAWVCTQSDEIWRLKCPYKEWAQKGDITLVDDLEISPELIANYIYQQAGQYNIRMIVMDSYRYDLVKDALRQYGFSYENKNIKLYRPSDVMRVIPIVTRCFQYGFFNWGDTPHLRWAANNTKLVPAKKSVLAVNGELDIGNFLYGKIEPHARKNDPFMALVASMVMEDCIREPMKPGAKRVRVKAY